MSNAPSNRSAPEPSFPEFVTLIAACTALTSLGIDTILPALPQIGRDFHVTHHNELQWILSAFVAGSGIGQLFTGTLSDWLGRRRVLMFGLGAYVVISFLVAIMPNLQSLIALRFLQGLCAAAGSVVPRSVVRDLYQGARMAKVMSTVQMVFLSVPVLAPSIGQMILLIAPWRGIFLLLAVWALLVFGWIFVRLPETLPLHKRQPPDIGHLRRTGLFIFTDRASLFYTLATMLMMANTMLYLSLMPAIFSEVFQKPSLLGPVFALCASFMVAGAFINTRWVERIGVRAMSHRAVTLLAGLALAHTLFATTQTESLTVFLMFQALCMSCVTLSTPNFAAIAMEKMAHAAGTAASLQGSAGMVGGAMIGTLIAQQWHGALWLLPLGTLICASGALISAACAEKGRLWVEPSRL